MRIGIPEALLYHRYEDQIKTFFDHFDADIIYSGSSNRQIMEEGIKNCVDEACLPMKVFQGHVEKLLADCDKVVVPRIMACEFGDSICPKFAGLPELIAKGKNEKKFLFTKPLYLKNKAHLKRTIIEEGKKAGLSKDNIMEAFKAVEKSKQAERRQSEQIKAEHEDYPLRVAVLGHPYNTLDKYINLNLNQKLKKLGVQVLNDKNYIIPIEKTEDLGLVKEPYWMFYRENLYKAMTIAKRNLAHGLIYLSSFNCGTDSVTIEITKSKIGDFPMLVLKLDEHTGEAGMDTRLEAFTELLGRRQPRP